MAAAFEPTAFESTAFETSGDAAIPLLTARDVPVGGLLDQYLDPVARDYVDTTDGEWYETPDSRTAVWIMLDGWLGYSYSAPGDGTVIGERLELGDPVTPELVVADYTRAMRILEAAGILTEFSIVSTDGDGNLLVSADGRFTPELRWIDLATSSPVDLAVQTRVFV